MDGAGLLADVFHDVDFAALGPVDGGDAVAEHPKCGPDALASGNFYARFESSIGLAEEIFRFNARGGVVTGYGAGSRCLLLRGDDQIARLHVGVLRVIGVELEFLVTPAVAAEVVGPFGWVGGTAVRGVEFVAPNQHVPRRRLDGLRGFRG